MNKKTTTSRILILLALCVIGWFAWTQYSDWFPPRNIPNFVHKAFRESELELISLSPKYPPDTTDGELFCGFNSLGSMKIKDRSTRVKLINSLDRSVGKNMLENARCYWPRHGIRCTHKGDQIDLIVCFECAPLTIFVNGERVFGAKVGESPKELYDSLLKSNNLPINSSPW